MSNLYGRSSIDASYQVSVYLTQRFQREIFFRNRPIRNKNCLYQPCLLTDRDETSNLYRGSSIYASYQVLVHLAKRFQRKRFFQKSTNQKQELPVVAMFVNGSGQNEQSLQRTFHRCFLPSFGSFGQAVQRRRSFRNPPINNKNCLWRSCLLTIRDKMRNLYRGCFFPNFGLFGKAVSEKILQKSTNQKQECTVAAMIVNGQDIQIAFQRNIWIGFSLYSFFRIAENKKHVIHFQHLYPTCTPKYYLDQFGQGFPLYLSFYIQLKTKCISLILSIQILECLSKKLGSSEFCLTE